VGISNDKKELAEIFTEYISRLYPDAACFLNHKTPFQLLVATILSAQCTDERVNEVTVELFKAYPDAKSMSEAEIEDIKNYIRPVGLLNNKSKSLYNMSRSLMGNYGGEVPDTLNELVKLAGVGRKTANVVLGNCFDVPGITVDTHVGRVSTRIGIAEKKTPEGIEKELGELLEPVIWTKWCHQTILFGRNICHSRKPDCENCEMKKYCLFYADNMTKK